MSVPLLESYVAGRWWSADDDGATVLDAVTGEPVARVGSAGVDAAALLDHALGGRRSRAACADLRPASRSARGPRRAAVRGRGSLVASLVTHDPGIAEDFVVGTAHAHGRILVLDRDDAAESTGHGIPMPMLVHGGPGRAGGGEELGGMRAVRRHLQRTAVQGPPMVLDRFAALAEPDAR